MSTQMSKSSTPANAVPAVPVRVPGFVPAVDIYETAEDYVVLAEMPGCDPKGIDVQFQDGELSIYGRLAPRETPESGWLTREFEIGDYGRTFNVTESIEADRISAEYEQGILTLRLPKAESSKPRRIEVRAK